MTTVVGVFKSRSQAQSGVEGVVMTGVTRDNVNILMPGASANEIAAVPTSDSEQPGMGGAVGGVVGGALGTAGGFGAGAAVASLLVPGVGPVLAIGLLGASLLGLSGAAIGAAAGQAMEDSVSGVPRDELYVYEDALRQGRTVVVAQAEDELHAEAARRALTDAGAESIDAARDQWWIGLRSAEQESYGEGEDFTTAEPYFRKGFEAAQTLPVRGKSYDEALEYLTKKYEISAANPAFRKGFERGKQHYEQITSQYKV